MEVMKPSRREKAGEVDWAREEVKVGGRPWEKER